MCAAFRCGFVMRLLLRGQTLHQTEGTFEGRSRTVMILTRNIFNCIAPLTFPGLFMQKLIAPILSLPLVLVPVIAPFAHAAEATASDEEGTEDARKTILVYGHRSDEAQTRAASNG